MRPLSRRRSTDRRGFSLVELLTAVGIVAILTAMAVPAYHRIRQRFHDAAALSDVINVAKAVEALDRRTNVSVTVLGPAGIRQVPGPPISKGTTLTLTRRVNARGAVTYTVRGRHANGTGATFLCQNGRVYAQGGARL